MALPAYPLVQVVILLACALGALAVGRRRLGIIFLALGLSWLWVASTPAFGGLLMRKLEADYPPVAAETLPAADAILLLGGGVHQQVTDAVYGDLNAWGDRLLFAVALFKLGKAPVLIVSGGGPEGEVSEAARTAEILYLMGVPEDSVILEERSRNTFDNARFSVPILNQHGLLDVLLVTSAFHMPRSVALFRAQGREVIPAPTDHQVAGLTVPLLDWLPGISGLAATHYALHEYVGYLAYRLLGRM